LKLPRPPTYKFPVIPCPPETRTDPVIVLFDSTPAPTDKIPEAVTELLSITGFCPVGAIMIGPTLDATVLLETDKFPSVDIPVPDVVSTTRRFCAFTVPATSSV
jgi:hypothetical protein